MLKTHDYGWIVLKGLYQPAPFFIKVLGSETMNDKKYRTFTRAVKDRKTNEVTVYDKTDGKYYNIKRFKVRR